MNSRYSKNGRSVFALCALLLPLAIAAFGQSGGVVGTVADPSGAPEPGVVVRAVSDGQELERAAVSDAQGSYALTGLAPGRYHLRVDQQGFQPFRRDAVEIPSAQVTVDIQLLLAEQRQSIAVVESPVQVETAGAQASSAISASQLASVPVNGRSFSDLVALAPGVVPASSRQPNAVVMSGCTAAPPSGDLNPGNLSAGGQRETSNAFEVNGSPAQEDFNMGAAIVPNLDSILELRVVTGNFDAERGNFGGAQVLLTTRSGAEQWHGSAFEYLRNTDLDARNYFAPERAQFGRNQFGGSVGGRVPGEPRLLLCRLPGRAPVPGHRDRPHRRAHPGRLRRRFLGRAQVPHRQGQRRLLGRPAGPATGLRRLARRTLLREREHFKRQFRADRFGGVAPPGGDRTALPFLRLRIDAPPCRRLEFKGYEG